MKVENFLIIIFFAITLFGCDINDPDIRSIEKYEILVDELIACNKYSEALEIHKKKMNLKNGSYQDYEYASELAFKAGLHDQCIKYIDSVFIEIESKRNNYSSYNKLLDEKYYLHDRKEFSYKNIFINLSDSNQIIKYLKDGIDINSSVDGETLLLKSAENGFIDILIFLNNKGINFNNYQQFSYESALMRAAKNNHFQIVKYLIDNKSNIHHTDINGETALFKAIKSGNVDIVDFLIKKGAKYNIKNDNGESPLMKAIVSNKLILIDYFFKKGLNINEIDNNGETSMLKAIKYCDMKVINYLLEKGCVLNDIDSEGEDALFKAAINGNIEIFSYLLERGFKLDKKNRYDENVIDKIIQYGSLDILKYINEHGLDVNYKDEYGKVLLLKAVEYGQIDLVKYLLFKGSDVSIKNDIGQDALLLCVQNNNIDIIKLLLQSGVDPCRNYNSENNPLYLAVKFQNRAIVRILLNYINDESIIGISFVSAAELGDLRMLDLLYKKNNEVNKYYVNLSFHKAVEKNDIELVRKIFNYGADINFKDFNGNTPLMLSLDSDYINDDIVKFLLKKQANIELTNNSMENALMISAKRANVDFVRRFIDAGISIDFKNIHGETALHLAIKNTNKYKDEYSSQDYHYLNIHDFHKNVETISFLLAKKANVNILNKSGDSPLILAAMKGHLELVKLLIFYGADVTLKNNNNESVLDIAMKSNNRKMVDYFSKLNLNKVK